MKELKMPSFGADMEQGRLTEWLVKPGDEIHKGDVVAIVETNKGAIELDVFESGVIQKLLIDIDQSVDVGAPIALIGTDEAERAPEMPEPASVPASKEAAKPPAADAADLLPQKTTAEQHLAKDKHFIPATPAARKLVSKHNLKLEAIKGTGALGAITLKDAEDALTKQHRSKGFDVDAMREAITATVTRSKKEIPHYYLSQTLDVTTLQAYLSDYNRNVETEQRIVLIAPMLSAVAKLLTKHKQLNGLYQNGIFAKSEHVQLANAVNLRGGGLVMPIIAEAEKLDAVSMMSALNDLVLRAKTGNLRFSELNGATVTVTSIGDRGADSIFGVIYPPQVSIIGLGRVREIAAIDDGHLSTRQVITATLAADHRVSDGHHGARFLYELNKRLQTPEVLWNQPKSET